MFGRSFLIEFLVAGNWAICLKTNMMILFVLIKKVMFPPYQICCQKQTRF